MDWCRFCSLKKGIDQFPGGFALIVYPSRQFGDGVEEVIHYPAVIAKSNEGVFPSTEWA